SRKFCNHHHNCPLQRVLHTQHQLWALPVVAAGRVQVGRAHATQQEDHHVLQQTQTRRQQRLATRLLGRLLGQGMLRKLLCRHQHHHAHQLRGQQLAGRHRKGCLRYTAAQPPALPVVARAFAFAGAGCCPLAGTRAAESGRTSHTARGLLGRLAGQQGCCASVS
ncbi:unnamed protein product, partial [Heterosigma akashiwo]